VALYRFSILIDNEFGEIPFDGVKESSALLLLQILPQRMRAFAIHFDLLEQVKLDLSIARKTLNFLSIARLLICKLIARKGENSQT
jgi:hypothetical protein